MVQNHGSSRIESRNDFLSLYFLALISISILKK
jgi:hypothetical protein